MGKILGYTCLIDVFFPGGNSLQANSLLLSRQEAPPGGNSDSIWKHQFFKVPKVGFAICLIDIGKTKIAHKTTYCLRKA